MRIVAVAHRRARWELDGRGAARGRREREALILELQTARCARGHGEAAPLPGLSSDTLDDAERVLEALAARVPFEAGDGLDAFADVAEAAVAEAAVAETAVAEAAVAEAAVAEASTGEASITSGAEARRAPAARFAIEAALAAALAAERGTTLAALLDVAVGAPGWPGLPPSVVVDDPDEARRAAAEGAHALKLKVGPGGDLDRIHAIAEAAPGVRLRLDANRSWPRATVRDRLAALASLPVDYIEEPCIDSHELLGEALPVPLALDESLAELARSAPVALDAALRAPSLGALVLKPTLIGVAGTLALAGRARAAGVPAIVTHCLESPVGRAVCAALAAGLAGSAEAARAPAIVTRDATLTFADVAAIARATNNHAASGHTVSDHAASDHAASDHAASDHAASDHAASGHATSGHAASGHAASDHAASGHATSGHAASGHAASDHAGRGHAETGHAASDHAASDHAASRRAADAPESSGGRTTTAALRRPATPPARCVIATPTVETLAAVHAALAERRPIALLHAKLPAAELARQRALVETARLPAGAAVVLFTSGSTGPARGVVLSRDALDAAADASARHLGWRTDDRWLLALSLAHAGGLAIAIRCLAARRPVALAGDGDSLAARLADCTLASLVPAQLASLLDDPAWRPSPQLRAVLLGGAAAPPSLLAAAAARGVPFLTTYGMTESFGQIATMAPDRAGDPAAPLVALPGVSIDAGARAAPAPIRVRGPMLASCYLDGAPIAPELVTADLGFALDGALHIAGRADDVIVTGGEKVHPLEVEAVLAATPGVRAACAFAVPDEHWGQLVGVALATAPGFDLAAAAARWHAALPPHARPRRLALTTELPLSPTGKPDRRAAARLPHAPLRYAKAP